MIRMVGRTLASLLVVLSATERLNAQEYTPSPRDFRSDSPEMAHGPIRWLSPVESDHAGLLGKRSVEGNYVRLHFDDAPPELKDDISGYSLAANTPLFQIDEVFPVQVDGFVHLLDVQYSTTFTVPIQTPPYEDVGAFKLGRRAVSLGTTVHTNHFSGFRPFVQLGVRLEQDDLFFSFPGFFELSERDHDEDMLLIPGIEVDVTRYAALRASIDVMLEDDTEASPCTVEIILWPHDHVFLKAGIVAALDGSGEGFTAGGGLAF